MRWKLAEAKTRFSELFERARSEGPQRVSRRGREAVVVLAEEEYERLAGGRRRFAEFLASAPGLQEVALERDRSPPREVEL